jgi:hypothetical protein
MSAPISRNSLVAILGTPDRTDGSLNDPVERDEHGIHFNEKWTFDQLKSDPAGVPMRIVYWHRYDFAGTMVRATADEDWRHDTTLLEALKSESDRRAPIDDHHLPEKPATRYRPVSQPSDDRDLGGYVQPYKES